MCFCFGGYELCGSLAFTYLHLKAMSQRTATYFSKNRSSDKFDMHNL